MSFSLVLVTEVVVLRPAPGPATDICSARGCGPAAELLVTQRKPLGGYATAQAGGRGAQPARGPGAPARVGSSRRRCTRPRLQPLTMRPIDRAVPAMIFSAASMEVAL